MLGNVCGHILSVRAHKIRIYFEFTLSCFVLVKHRRDPRQKIGFHSMTKHRPQAGLDFLAHEPCRGYDTKLLLKLWKWDWRSPGNFESIDWHQPVRAI
jgi:hypothetical protein